MATKKIVTTTKAVDVSDFGSFAEFVDDILDLDGDVSLARDNGDCLNFCYFDQLIGSEMVKPELIPLTLAAAIHQNHNRDGVILHVSVTSEEPNYNIWLEQMADYPGSTVTALCRGGRDKYISYAIMFPSNDGKLPEVKKPTPAVKVADIKKVTTKK